MKPEGSTYSSVSNRLSRLIPQTRSQKRLERKYWLSAALELYVQKGSSRMDACRAPPSQKLQRHTYKFHNSITRLATQRSACTTMSSNNSRGSKPLSSYLTNHIVHSI